MSIAALFNHRVLVYRPNADEDKLGDPGQGGFIPISTEPVTGFNARPDDAWSGTLQDRGPGEEQSATRRWFLEAGMDVEERDVLDVRLGPEAPVKVRVLSVTKPAAPLGIHHLEANVEPFDGDVI